MNNMVRENDMLRDALVAGALADIHQRRRAIGVVRYARKLWHAERERRRHLTKSVQELRDVHLVEVHRERDKLQRLVRVVEAELDQAIDDKIEMRKDRDRLAERARELEAELDRVCREVDTSAAEVAASDDTDTDAPFLAVRATVEYLRGNEESATERAEAAEAERDKWKAHADRSDTELGAVADALPIPDWTPGDGTHADAVRKVVAQRDRLRAQQQPEVSPAHPLCNALGCQLLSGRAERVSQQQSIRARHCCKTYDLPHHPHEDNCRAQQQPEPQPAAEPCPDCPGDGMLSVVDGVPMPCPTCNPEPQPSPSAEVPECERTVPLSCERPECEKPRAAYCPEHLDEFRLEMFGIEPSPSAEVPERCDTCLHWHPVDSSAERLGECHAQPMRGGDWLCMNGHRGQHLDDCSSWRAKQPVATAPQPALLLARTGGDVAELRRMPPRPLIGRQCWFDAYARAHVVESGPVAALARAAERAWNDAGPGSPRLDPGSPESVFNQWQCELRKLGELGGGDDEAR